MCCRTSQTAAAPCRSGCNAARNWIHTRDRSASPLDSSDYTRDSSQLERLCDFRRADRRADLREQPVRLVKLMLPARFVADQPRQLSTLDVEEGLVALRARHLEPSVGFPECCL